MRVYYTANRYQGCYNVRCLIPMHSGGWDGEQITLNTPPKDQGQVVQEAMQSDVVVFHRPSDPKKTQAAKLFQQAGIKVVLDNDDTYIPNSGVSTTLAGKLEKYSQTLEDMNKELYEFAKNADLITVTTEVLAEEYRKLGCKNVKVLPNCVEPFDWTDEPRRNKGDKLRIGLIGSVLIAEDFKVIRPILDELSTHDDITLVTLGFMPDNDKYQIAAGIQQEDREYFENLPNVEMHIGTMAQDYNEKLDELELDLAIIPRYDSYFNRCKSNLKFLEMSMLEIPVIAQGYEDGKSPYQLDPEDAKHMIICTNEEEWIPAIMELKDRPEKRREMGRKAKEYVVDKYSIDNNIHLWEDAYQSII